MVPKVSAYGEEFQDLPWTPLLLFSHAKTYETINS